MNRITLAVAVAVLVAFAFEAPRASAQPQVPGGGTSRQAFSPYLNLLNNGRSPAFNYLGIVRPQQQLNQQFGQLQQQLTTQNQAINQAISAEEALIPPTGNVSSFNTTAGYFNRVPGITMAGSPGGFSRPLGAFGGQGGAGNQPGFSKPSGSKTRR